MNFEWIIGRINIEITGFRKQVFQAMGIIITIE